MRAAAIAAHARALYAESLAHWAAFRAAMPTSEDGFASAILTAKAARQDDVARQLQLEGAAAFPSKAESFRALAESASWEAADDKWHSVMAGPPTDRKRELLAAIGPLRLASAGKRRFKVVLSRIEIVEERFPNYAKAFAAHLSVLGRMKRYEKAVQLAAHFTKKFPEDQKLALAHISFLDITQDFAGAFALISALRARTSPSPAIEAAYIQALSRLGRLDEADQTCAKAVASFPDSTELMREYAVLATRRGDWTEALARWEAAEQKLPDSVMIKQGLSATRLQLADREIPGSEAQQGETGQLFARFESLGGSFGGCEFGIVQRKFGSTALGLLRYSNVRVEALIEGMRSGFDGMGDIANTQLKTYRPAADREEYIVWDAKYGLGSHTFIEVKNAPADKMLVQTAKRLSFLRGRLLEEMRSAKKIFVYKFRDQVDDATIQSVFEAVRTQGEVTLFCILKANDSYPKGSLRQLADGLFVGYLGYFMAEGPVTDASVIDYVTWKDLCTKMLAAHEQELPHAPNAAA
jgi:tetratricopeptide (TPR) repeat protein